MKIAVLISAGTHPVSGAAVVPRTEAQAIRMAAALGEVVGMHAGANASAVTDALGLGLARIEHVAVPDGTDPIPSLAARLEASRPDLILAGRRGQGGDETGFTPYALAAMLEAPLISDVVAIAPGDTAGTLSVDQSLGRGALRRLVVRLPAILTIHPDAPAPLPFAFGRARKGRIDEIAVAPPAVAPREEQSTEERPYRKRPKIMKGAPSGVSASERLKAATGESGATSGKVMIGPNPEEAAREILAFLRGIGVLAPPKAVSGENHPKAEV